MLGLFTCVKSIFGNEIYVISPIQKSIHERSNWGEHMKIEIGEDDTSCWLG